MFWHKKTIMLLICQGDNLISDRIDDLFKINITLSN